MKRFLSGIILLTFGLVVFASIVTAQSNYPTYNELYVHDYAGLLDTATADYLRSTLAKLKQDSGIEVAIVTIKSIKDYNTGDATIEAFATNLFNTWGIGNATRNDGVLILVAVGDRKVRIEVGSGYGTTLNAAMQSVIDENILPAFRNDNYNAGIYSGTRAVIHALTGTWPAELEGGVVGSAAGSAATQAANPLVLLGGGGLAFGAVGVGFQRFMRHRKRPCPKCGQLMDRLDEIQDDAFLNEGEQREENLGSVDYDVWKCAHCGTHRTFRYSRWFSPYSNCPQCHYRAVKVTRNTRVSASYTSAGEREVRKTCYNCKFSNVSIEAIPMLQHSDSSSSGGSNSYSGGRSSGGGASGDW